MDEYAQSFRQDRHKVMVRVLRYRMFPKDYMYLISILYGIQRTSVNHSSEFLVQRGVKQADTSNAILINCILDIVVDEVRLSLHQ